MNRIEQKSRGNPIESVVRDVVSVLNTQGLLPLGAQVIVYQSPCPYVKRPDGRPAAYALETGYAIADRSRISPNDDLEQLKLLAIVEKFHDGEKSGLQGPSLKLNGFRVSINSAGLHYEKTKQVVASLLVNVNPV